MDIRERQRSEVTQGDLQRDGSASLGPVSRSRAEPLELPPTVIFRLAMGRLGHSPL